MSTKTKTLERNGTVKSLKSEWVWSRAFTANSEWPDKVGLQLKFSYYLLKLTEIMLQEEFLDVIYWIRQVLGVLLGIIWGLVPLRGFLGLAL